MQGYTAITTVEILAKTAIMRLLRLGGYICYYKSLPENMATMAVF